ncbi:MAG: 23S rRNA (uracil(1939)-C(5))-methyltransferase RlmD [Desulfuromonadales bacterium]|nr:23S rRNA (uracil(1939)-C(5))-methyltransferase RlmD [Desulfuromonadales bacterium]
MLELQIDKLTHGGRGMGRHDGKAVFVPLTCPGDLVRCRVTRDKGRYAEAELQEIIEPSELRREPPCPLFGECGGCQWQHLPYPVQCDWKMQIFKEFLCRRDIVAAENILPLAAAPEEFHYRNRVQLKCRMTDRGMVVGFYRSGSHFVVDVERCLLIAPPIQKVLTFLRVELASAPTPASISQIDVSCGDGGEARVILHALPETGDKLLPWLAATAQRGGFNAFLQTGRKGSLRCACGTADLVQRVGSDRVELQAGPGCFTQVNRAQNSVLIDAVVAAADLQGGERVLDLFCGIGNFSLPLARRAAEVVGVEDFAPAIDDARRNASANQIGNARFFAEDARGAIRRHQSGGRFDLVVLDPPRSGCYPIVKELLQAQPERILYVSCNPATLARDLSLMVHNGYAAVQSLPVDLFPQTWHLESISLLERVG